MKKELKDEMEQVVEAEEIVEKKDVKVILEELIQNLEKDAPGLIIVADEGHIMSLVNSGTCDNSLANAFLNIATGLNRQGMELKLALLDVTIYLANNDPEFAKELNEQLKEINNDKK